VAVVVFDADVLIGFLGRTDPHHAEAVERIRGALESGTRRLLSAVTYAEVLVGPLKTGLEARVEQMISRFGVETVVADAPLAARAAAIRAQTRLGLPDAFVLATALQAQTWGEDVRVESFDERVCAAYAALRAGGPG